MVEKQNKRTLDFIYRNTQQKSFIYLIYQHYNLYRKGGGGGGGGGEKTNILFISIIRKP